MNITAILIAAAVIAVAGIIVGIGLGLFGGVGTLSTSRVRFPKTRRTSTGH